MYRNIRNQEPDGENQKQLQNPTQWPKMQDGASQKKWAEKWISCFYRQHRGSIPGPLACGSNALHIGHAALHVYHSWTNLNELIGLIEEDLVTLTVLTDWFCANKLSLNVYKTNVLVFSHKVKLFPMRWQSSYRGSNNTKS